MKVTAALVIFGAAAAAAVGHLPEAHAESIDALVLDEDDDVTLDDAALDDVHETENSGVKEANHFQATTRGSRRRSGNTQASNCAAIQKCRTARNCIILKNREVCKTGCYRWQYGGQPSYLRSSTGTGNVCLNSNCQGTCTCPRNSFSNALNNACPSSG